MRIGGPRDAGHRIVVVPVAEGAALERRPHSGLNRPGAFGRWKIKDIAAKHRRVMRVTVVALARIILLIARIIHSGREVREVGTGHRMAMMHLGEVSTE